MVYEADPAATRATLDPDGDTIACPDLPLAGFAPARWTDGIPAAAEPAQVIGVSDGHTLVVGVLHSRLHRLWSLQMGTSQEDRPRYTPTTCFKTFPLPWPPGAEPVHDPRVVAIAQAARDVDEQRERWLNPEGASVAELKTRTLTNLYNQRPTWLQHVHAALDRALWAASGWPVDEDQPTVEEDVIPARLLALNGERSGV
jgi:hypothetical protein